MATLNTSCPLLPPFLLPPFQTSKLPDSLSFLIVPALRYVNEISFSTKSSPPFSFVPCLHWMEVLPSLQVQVLELG